ncbi:MAG: hypothetical protein IPP72_09450 [Chitinophagaceae bacterium]|nr:hypothetical protein [Chitinophagaceae bacterium]
MKKDSLLRGWRIEAVTPVKHCAWLCAGVRAKKPQLKFVPAPLLMAPKSTLSQLEAPG